MRAVLLILYYVLPAVGAICLALAGLSCTKRQRDRFPLLQRLDGKKLYLTFFGVVCILAVLPLHWWKDTDAQTRHRQQQRTLDEIRDSQNKLYLNVNTHTTGVLRPKESESARRQPGPPASWHYDLRETSVMQFQLPVGQVMLPLGDNVPFWITKSSEGISVCAEIKSFDGKIVAELINNQWRVNPHNYFKLNYDSSGLEVSDDYNIIWLQIDYLTPSSIRIGGLFRSEDGLPGRIPDFPRSAVVPSRIVQNPPGSLFILGNRQFRIIESPSLVTDAQREDFADMVREIVQPWFDYTPSKGLGVRLPPEPKVTTDPFAVQIPSSPVSGTLSGQSFKYDKATLDFRGLILSQGDARVIITILLKRDINTRATLIPKVLVSTNSYYGSQIFVELNWKEGTKSKRDFLTSDYVMRLEFGTPNENRIPGKLYLECPRRQQTNLAGTFDAEMNLP